MTNVPTKVSLSTRKRRLLELMQRINFGRIEGLMVRNSEPVLDPPPRIIRDFKFGAENGPRPELTAGDFALKSQVIELFEQLDNLGDGTVEMLEVQRGLPFRLTIEETAQA